MGSGSFKNVIYKMCLEIIYHNFIFPTEIALTTKHSDIVIWFIKVKKSFHDWVNGLLWRKFRMGTSA